MTYPPPFYTIFILIPIQVHHILNSTILLNHMMNELSRSIVCITEGKDKGKDKVRLRAWARTRTYCNR